MQREDAPPVGGHHPHGRRAPCAGDFYPDEAIAAFAWPLLMQAGGLAELEGARLT